MKLHHRVPIDQVTKSAVLDPAYQAEVDRTMERADVSYRRAQSRLAAAERRLQRARSSRATVKPRHHRRHLDELEAMVELRRIELERYHRLLVATGAPSTSRGRRSFRQVPAAKAL